MAISSLYLRPYSEVFSMGDNSVVPMVKAGHGRRKGILGKLDESDSRLREWPIWLSTETRDCRISRPPLFYSFCGRKTGISADRWYQPQCLWSCLASTSYPINCLPFLGTQKHWPKVTKSGLFPNRAQGTLSQLFSKMSPQGHRDVVHVPGGETSVTKVRREAVRRGWSSLSSWLLERKTWETKLGRWALNAVQIGVRFDSVADRRESNNHIESKDGHFPMRHVTDRARGRCFQ